jgi:hypothetical protein
VWTNPLAPERVLVPLSDSGAGEQGLMFVQDNTRQAIKDVNLDPSSAIIANPAVEPKLTSYFMLAED